MRSKIVASFFDEGHRKWWTLAAVSFGLFMIMLDNTIVNVALPTIQRSLDLKISELEWVVTGYALTFAAFMLTGGKLADLLGRRLVFVAGLAVFTAASLACGLAGGADMLIGARVVQGIGAAMMNPATLSIITATFPPRQRGTAIGIWAGVSALALAIGPLVGGLLSEHVDWSWIFFVNVPVGVIAIIAAFLFVDESRDTSRNQRPDVPRPGRSRLSCVSSFDSVTSRSVAPMASMPTGTLMKKIQCQLRCSVSRPPTSGPIASASAETPAQIPIAAPRCFGGKVAEMIDSVAGFISAAPAPWTIRAMISISLVFERPHQSDARVKITIPTTKMRRRP